MVFILAPSFLLKEGGARNEITSPAYALRLLLVAYNGLLVSSQQHGIHTRDSREDAKMFPVMDVLN